MPAGLIIYNNTMNIQFTDSYQNFVLIGKGSGVLGPPWTYVSTTGGPYATITVPNYYGWPPLIGISSATPMFIRDAVQDGSGNWVFGIAGQYASAQGAGFSFYVFGPPTTNVSPANYGLEVRRADGSLAYNSGWSPLKIVGQIGNEGQGTTFTGQGGRTYTVIHVLDQFAQSAPVPAGTWRVQGSGTQHTVNGATATLTSGQIYTTIWGTFPPFSTEYNQPRARHLIADVTDY